MWQLASQISSSPGCVCDLMPIWLDIVPDGTYTAASLPNSAATRSSSRLTVGSSWKTSSPTSAACMEARMPGVGRVTVSLRRSIGSGMSLITLGWTPAVLQIPAVALLHQSDDAVLDVLEANAGGALLDRPPAVLAELLQQLDGGGVEAGLDVGHRVGEL